VCSAEVVAGDALVVAVVGRLKVADGESERHASVQLVKLVRHVLARQGDRQTVARPVEGRRRHGGNDALQHHLLTAKLLTDAPVWNRDFRRI